MRNIASRLTPARVIALTTVVAAGGVIGLGAGAPVAAAATLSAPTLVVTDTPSEIGVTDSAGIAYTITNPNASGSLYNLAFVDTLAIGTTVDNPSGLTSSGCGTPSIGASPGNGGVGATGVTVKAGTPCVITLSTVGDSVGVGADTLGPLTYSTTANGAVGLTAPAANEAPATLTVLAAPTATISGPKSHARYTYGEKVTARYACGAPEDANGTTLSACLGSDDLGNAVNSGAAIDTTDPGVHSLSVQSLDNDGDSANASVTYTVLPDNIVAVKTLSTARNGGVKLGLGVPGAGTVKVTETHGTTRFAAKTVRVGRASTALSVPLTPTTAGRKLLAAHHRVRVILAVTYTPRGGAAHTITRVLTLG